MRDNVATKEAGGNKLLVFEVLIGEFMIYRFVQRDCLIVIVASVEGTSETGAQVLHASCKIIMNTRTQGQTHTQKHTRAQVICIIHVLH